MIQRLRTHSIRRLLTILILCTVLPALGVIVYSGLEQRRSELANAQRNCALLVESIAKNLENTIAAARQLLMTLAQLPQYKTRDAGGCNALFAGLLRKNPIFNTFSAADATGKIFAAGIPFTPFSASERRYFKNVVRTHAFSSGEYVISNIALEPTIHFSMPVLGDRGELLATVQAGIDTDRFDNYLQLAHAPSGTSLVITDHAGRIMHHTLEPQKYEGRFDTPESFNAIKTHCNGEPYHFIEADGIRRIYFSKALTLAEEDEPYLYIRMGVPESLVYSQAHLATMRNLGLMGLVSLIALAAAWLVGEVRIVRPVRRLVAASQRLAAGNLSARAGIPYFSGELGLLARSFDEMSQALAQREEERNRAEETLRLTQFAVDHVAMPIGWTDAGGTRAYANAAFCQMVGCAREELVGQKIWEIDTGLDEAKWQQRFEEIRQLGSKTFEGHYYTRTGDKGECRVMANFIAFGEHQFIMSFVHDVSEEKQAENRVRQAQKMEAIGTLAGGIAHDFNNLLTGILGYANLLTLENPPDSKTYEAARVIEKAAERAADLTRQLLGFARKGKFLNVAFKVHPLIGEVVQLLSRTLDKSISITQRLRAGQAGVIGDPSQVQQVILNLALNARDAMPAGGELTIETGLVTLDEEYCRAHPQATPGRYVLIAVSDTGSGIPRDIQHRIFEPFFTTKENGKGSGMGLAMVYGIIKNHGGSIQLYSEPGLGTRFNVYLPASEDPAEARSDTVPNPPDRGSGRIMLIDDEEIPRNMAQAMLESLGYQVTVFSEGEAAVGHYQAHWREINLILLDMIMPHMNGRDCYRALRRINPAVRAILSSGYSRDGFAQEILEEGMQGFIQKPYRLNELSSAIAAALRGD